MKFLSQEELLRIAQLTAYPSPLAVRSTMVLQTVLTMPTHEAYAPREGEGRIFNVASVFATLLVRMKPFSTSNLEIACRGIDHLLTKNDLALSASDDTCREELLDVESGDRSSADFVMWLEAHCTARNGLSQSAVRIQSKHQNGQ